MVVKTHAFVDFANFEAGKMATDTTHKVGEIFNAKNGIKFLIKVKISKQQLKEIIREELASLNEDQYGDVSFSRRKLKLAHEDAECILTLFGR